MLNPHDAKLLARAKAGNQEAFGLLCEKYKDRLYHYIFHRLPGGDEHLANDVFQETWKRVMPKLKTFREDADFSTWLIGFAKWCQHEINEKRQKREKRETSLEQMFHTDKEGREIPFEPEAPTPTPPENVIKEEEISQLKEAIEELPEKYRIPIIQRYVWDLEIDQIVKNMNLNGKGGKKVSAGMVSKWLERAKKLLKKRLEGKEL